MERAKKAIEAFMANGAFIDKLPLPKDVKQSLILKGMNALTAVLTKLMEDYDV